MQIQPPAMPNPTTKDGQTIDVLLAEFYDRAVNNYDVAERLATQAIEQLIEERCAEREYASYLRGMIHAYEAIPAIINKNMIDPVAVLRYYKEKETNLRMKLHALQAQPKEAIHE